MNIKVTITRSENAEYFNCSIGDTVDVDFGFYVAAVVASEIGNSPVEACKAQAVAARTYAVWKGVLRGKAISDSSATAQAFRARRYSQAEYPNAITGEKETDGEILVWHGKPAETVYSASNGGRTVSSRERWGNEVPYLQAQPDPWDAAFGKPKSGHGVGLSQNGAKWAAKNGIGYREILSFYYPGCELASIGEGSKAVNERAQAIVDLAKSKLGDPYVYGASGQKCTPEVRRRYASYHPEYKSKIYGACPVLSDGRPGCAGCQWNGHLCYDCRGFTSYVLRTAANIDIKGGGATSQYNTGSNWMEQGALVNMPDVVCCVFKKKGEKMSHTGLHVGGGKIIHCSTIVKEGRTSDSGWTHYAIPAGLYSPDEIDRKVIPLRDTVKRGDRGETVRQLQFALYQLDHEELMIDGIFGAKTDAAVRDFQTKCGLNPDGIVGPKTWEAIDKILDGTGTHDLPDDEPETETEPDMGHVVDDGEPCVPNVPVKLVYPAGQKIKLDAATAADIVAKIQEKAGSNPVEIIAGVGFNVELTAVGAMNLYQQMREQWGVTK